MSMTGNQGMCVRLGSEEMIDYSTPEYSVSALREAGPTLGRQELERLKRSWDLAWSNANESDDRHSLLEAEEALDLLEEWLSGAH